MTALATRIARALLPSWRFFDDVQPAPRLFVRLALAGGGFGAWQRVMLVPARGLGAMLLHPEGSLALAEHGLLEQLLSDVAEPDVSDAGAVEGLTSYQLVTRLARRHARSACARSDEPARTHFQFKLRSLELGRSADTEEDVLVSRLHELQEA